MAKDASTQLYDGTISVTDTVLHELPVQEVSEVLIQNDPASAGNLKIGGPNCTIVLIPGASLSVQVVDVDVVYYKAGSTATLNWLGRN